MTYLDYRRALKLGQKPSESAKGGKSPEKPENGEEEAKPVKPAKKTYPKRIANTSKKRAKQNRKYTPIKKKFLADNPTCQARLDGCTGQSTDLHHAAGRSGKQLLKVDDFIALCRNCHDKMEILDKEARAAGLKKTRLGKPNKT
jgi:hypothetical protein